MESENLQIKNKTFISYTSYIIHSLFLKQLPGVSSLGQFIMRFMNFKQLCMLQDILQTKKIQQIK